MVNEVHKDPIFLSFYESRNLKKSTITGYASALQLYVSIVELNLKELLDEAYSDEEKGILLKNRCLKNHLITFRNYLLKNLSPGSAREYFNKVKTFYKHFEVEIPHLPDAKYDTNYQISYNDLPTKEHILKALSIATQEMKAIIMFMATSGTARTETLSLTVNDFIKATNHYHDGNDLKNILNMLEIRDDVVPTWYLKRVKTGKYYYAFNHPEATIEIINYLKTRDDLTPTDNLFSISPAQLLVKFQEINDHFGWGFKGNYRFFRSHTLRKFHASNIKLNAEHIDALQGRSKNIVHETYIKTNPKELKRIYMDAMHNLSFNNKKSHGCKDDISNAKILGNSRQFGNVQLNKYLEPLLLNN